MAALRYAAALTAARDPHRGRPASAVPLTPAPRLFGDIGATTPPSPATPPQAQPGRVATAPRTPAPSAFPAAPAAVPARVGSDVAAGPNGVRTTTQVPRPARRDAGPHPEAAPGYEEHREQPATRYEPTGAPASPVDAEPAMTGPAGNDWDWLNQPVALPATAPAAPAVEPAAAATVAGSDVVVLAPPNDRRAAAARQSVRPAAQPRSHPVNPAAPAPVGSLTIGTIEVTVLPGPAPAAVSAETSVRPRPPAEPASRSRGDNPIRAAARRTYSVG